MGWSEKSKSKFCHGTSNGKLQCQKICYDVCQSDKNHFLIVALKPFLSIVIILTIFLNGWISHELMQ